MNVIEEIKRINKLELQNGVVNTSASWHDKYKQSAWVYVGNLPKQLSEGDILAVMSQWGEIDDIHLVRDEETGASRGFGFVKYVDSRSCVLAVDNFCGSKVLERSLRVDHVENYRLPKHIQEKEEEDANLAKGILKAGHAYEGKELANQYDINKGQDLFGAPLPEQESDAEEKLAKKQRKELRRQNKEQRAKIRHERQIRREEREERKRAKRAKKMSSKKKRKRHDSVSPPRRGRSPSYSSSSISRS